MSFLRSTWELWNPKWGESDYRCSSLRWLEPNQAMDTYAKPSIRYLQTKDDAVPGIAAYRTDTWEFWWTVSLAHGITSTFTSDRCRNASWKDVDRFAEASRTGCEAVRDENAKAFGLRRLIPRE
jgi:hypothetical protein